MFKSRSDVAHAAMTLIANERANVQCRRNIRCMAGRQAQQQVRGGRAQQAQAGAVGGVGAAACTGGGVGAGIRTGASN
jgi:hypothetical protein